MQTLSISGMTCNTCATHVKDVLEKLPGVKSARVSYPQGTAQVVADAGVSLDAMAAAVAKAGYSAKQATRSPEGSNGQPGDAAGPARRGDGSGLRIAVIGSGGAGGTITIDASGLSADGLIFNSLTSGQYTIAANAGDTLTLTGVVTLNNNAAISAPIVGSGNLIVSGTPGDTLTLSGNNTYSGGTTLEGGVILNFQNPTSTTSNFGAGAITIGAGGATLQYGAANLTVANNLILADTGTIDVHGQTGTWSGTISGQGSLILTDAVGGGVLSITASNSYGGYGSGTTILEHGVTVSLPGAGSYLGYNPITFGTGGGELQYGSAGAIYNPVVLTGNGAIDVRGNNISWFGVISGGANLTLTDSVGGGSFTVDNDTTGLTGNLINNTALTFAQSADSSVSGVISGSERRQQRLRRYFRQRQPHRKRRRGNHVDVVRR